MRRGKADALQPLDRINRFEQLHERGLSVPNGNIAPAIARNNLPQQGDLLHALRHQVAAFGHDVGNPPAALLPAGVRHDAEGAILVAALHDAHKRRDGLRAVPLEQMLANRPLAPLLFPDLHHFLASAGEQVIQILRRVMEFLRAHDEVHVRQPVNQFASPRLCDTAHEAEHNVGPAPAGLTDDVLHLAESLLLGQVAHAARIEQDDIGGGLIRRKRIALGHELRGDGLAVALVHLAPVSLYVNTRHLR